MSEGWESKDVNLYGKCMKRKWYAGYARFKRDLLQRFDLEWMHSGKMQEPCFGSLGLKGNGKKCFTMEQSAWQEQVGIPDEVSVKELVW